MNFSTNYQPTLIDIVVYPLGMEMTRGRQGKRIENMKKRISTYYFPYIGIKTKPKNRTGKGFAFTAPDERYN